VKPSAFKLSAIAIACDSVSAMPNTALLAMSRLLIADP
jgi:hypothetical protein